eukprot:1159649-Pelagomonas_calceolata.AAC.15
MALYQGHRQIGFKELKCTTSDFTVLMIRCFFRAQTSRQFSIVYSSLGSFAANVKSSADSIYVSHARHLSL